MPVPVRATRKPSLSPTKISTYLTCSLKYRYVYIDKIGKFYQKSKSYFSFGTSLHQTIESFHSADAPPTVEQMSKNLETSWISAGYVDNQQETEHKELGREIVVAYHTTQMERVERQVETIGTEKTLTCDMGSFTLTGRIDRLDQHSDGTIEIMDYKSGAREITSEEVRGDMAMSCYQLMVSRIFPGSPVIATIYNLRSGSESSVQLTVEELEQFGVNITELGQEILNSDYDQLVPEKKAACEWCDFLPKCEKWWKLYGEGSENPFDD